MKTCLKLWNVAVALWLTSTALAQTAYNYDELQREKLGRGVVAIRENPSEVALSWRYLSSDPIETSFNIYRNGKKVLVE